MELTTESLVRITISGEDLPAFRSAMAKIYQQINKTGFDHLGLSKEEQWVFNDVVQEMANESET